MANARNRQTEPAKTETPDTAQPGGALTRLRAIFHDPKFVMKDSNREYTNNEGKKNETTEIPLASVILPYRNADGFGAAANIYATKAKGKPAVLTCKFAGSRSGTGVMALDLAGKAELEAYKGWIAEQYVDYTKTQGGSLQKTGKIAAAGVPMEGLDTLFTS